MAEAAAARREARRKRILENSHNRLELIAGKKSSENCSQESPSKYSCSDQDILTNYQYSDQESSAAASSSSTVTGTTLNNGILWPDPDSNILLSETRKPIPPADSEIANDLAAFAFPSQEGSKEKSRLEVLVAYKYDIVLMTIIIQTLYNLFIFENTYFFLPVVMYTLTKLIWFPEQSNFNLASAVLMMNGISANKAQKLMYISQWATAISQDICIYVFTTICIQSLLSTFNHYFAIIY